MFLNEDIVSIFTLHTICRNTETFYFIRCDTFNIII
nr:MAG TPA: hypothetical protein [Caudoviricetes sp.]